MLLKFIRAEYGSKAAEDHMPASRFDMLRHALSPTGAQLASRRR